MVPASSRYTNRPFLILLMFGFFFFFSFFWFSSFPYQSPFDLKFLVFVVFWSHFLSPPSASFPHSLLLTEIIRRFCRLSRFLLHWSLLYGGTSTFFFSLLTSFSSSAPLFSSFCLRFFFFSLFYLTPSEHTYLFLFFLFFSFQTIPLHWPGVRAFF